MAQFTVYSSTDASAPVLTGEVGSLVALLDACLVNGYGAKTAAGWTKPYTGTNKAAFRQGTGSCSFYLRVQDDGPGTGAAREARITGYETMTTVDAGGNSFPLASQGIGTGTIAAFVMHKSNTADAVAVPWILFADSKTLYLYTVNTTQYGVMGFGDFYSLVPGTADAWRCFIAGNDRENATAVTQEYMCHFTFFSDLLGNWGRPSALTSPTVARSYNGVIGSTVARWLGDGYRGAIGAAAYGALQTPNFVDQAYYVCPLTVGIPLAKQIRGRMRGLHQWLHPVGAVATGNIIAGTGEMAGKSFYAIVLSDEAVNMIEISDTLETNV